MAEEEAELVVDGEPFRNWQTVEVRLSIEDIAGSFSVGFTDPGAAIGAPFPIREGDAVTVRLAGEQVIAGYVDDFDISDDATGGRKLFVSGRSRAGDLLDCSTLLRPLVEQTPLAIAKLICEPFGIDVLVPDARAEADPNFQKTVPLFAVEPGETCFDALTRLMRGRAVLITSNPEGDIELVRAGFTQTDAVLRYGDNLKTRAYRGSMRERFSQYRIRGQTPGNDRWNKHSASTMIATADDEGVERYRPMLIMADDVGTFEQLEKRGEWERNTRAAKAQRYSCTARGWTHGKPESGGIAAASWALGQLGSVWRPNTRVRVVDDPLGIDTYLLLVSAAFSRSEGGRMTSLELAPPEGYAPLAVPPQLIKLKRRRPRPKNVVKP